MTRSCPTWLYSLYFAACREPPAVGLPATAAVRHFASAAVSFGALSFRPLVLKIGPLPELFGGGRSMPFWGRQAANLSSRAWRRALAAACTGLLGVEDGLVAVFVAGVAGDAGVDCTVEALGRALALVTVVEAVELAFAESPPHAPRSSAATGAGTPT
jgi:hypothetical protein